MAEVAEGGASMGAACARPGPSVICGDSRGNRGRGGGGAMAEGGGRQVRQGRPGSTSSSPMVATSRCDSRCPVTSPRVPEPDTASRGSVRAIIRRSGEGGARALEVGGDWGLPPGHVVHVLGGHGDPRVVARLGAVGRWQRPGVPGRARVRGRAPGKGRSAQRMTAAVRAALVLGIFAGTLAGPPDQAARGSGSSARWKLRVKMRKGFLRSSADARATRSPRPAR
jgi:hypothetical protein